MLGSFFACDVLTIVSFEEVTVILECQFVLVFCDNDSCSIFVFLMSYRVMKPLKNTLCIIFPYFGRDKRVLWIDFEPIVSYSVQQLTRGSYEWYSVDVTKA